MAVTSFISTVWQVPLEEKLRKTLVGEAFVNHNVEGEVLQGGGGSVKINTIGDVTLRAYDGTTITYDEASTSAATLDIDNVNYCAVEIDDVDKVQCADGSNLFNEYVDEMAYKIADGLDSATFTEIAGAALAANTVGSDASPITVNSTASAKEVLRKIKVIMDKAGVPKDNRRLAATTDFVSYLVFDETINKADATSEASLVNGYVGKLYGFEIYETENIPDTTGNNAQIVASRPAFTAEVNELQQMEALRGENTFKDKLRVLSVSGVKTYMPAGVAKAIVAFQ